jgi:hypothetical protein
VIGAALDRTLIGTVEFCLRELDMMIVAAAQALRAAARNSHKTPPRVKSEPGPPATLGNAAGTRRLSPRSYVLHYGP